MTAQIEAALIEAIEAATGTKDLIRYIKTIDPTNYVFTIGRRYTFVVHPSNFYMAYYEGNDRDADYPLPFNTLLYVQTLQKHGL